MEAYPLLFACSHAAEPKPKGFVVKSVCDFADESKNDDYQDYAAYTSANVCAQLIELLLK
jgi:nucleoside phosphorylase